MVKMLGRAPGADYKWANRRRSIPRRVGAKVTSAPGRLLQLAIVKTWDVIIIGGGIIGLSLAIALRKRGGRVLLVERGEPGREASHAAAGMLADSVLEMPAALEPLARASAGMYPEFVHELQDESGIDVDLRDQGTLLFPASDHPVLSANHRLPAPLAELEPALAA